MKFRNEEEMIRIYETIADTLKDGDIPHILELGCRDGKGTVAFLKRMIELDKPCAIVAIDQNELAIKDAKAYLAENVQTDDKYYLDFVCKDIDSLDFAKIDKPDYIIIVDRDDYILPSEEEIQNMKKYATEIIMIKPRQEALTNPLYKSWCVQYIDRELGILETSTPHDFPEENYLCLLNTSTAHTAYVGRRPTLLAYIVSAGRSESTLPLAVASIINSDVIPDELIIIDDNKPSVRFDYNEHPMYKYLTALAHQRGIKFNILLGPGEGQTKTHDYILKTIGKQYDYVLRLDDDCILTPSAIGIMRMKLDQYPEYGAVSGRVWIPGSSRVQPTWAKGKLSTQEMATPQWYRIQNDIEVEHLHCSFMYRSAVALASDGYDTTLSPVGHTEETIFSHNLYRTGAKLLVIKDVLIYHLRYPVGGIRDNGTDKLREYCFQADEEKFDRYLDAIGIKTNEDIVLCHLSFALGDHIMFLSALPKILEYWQGKGKEIVVATDWLDFTNLLKDTLRIDGVKFVTLEESSQVYRGVNAVYAWMVNNNWDGHLIDGMVKMFTTDYDTRKIYGGR